MSMKRWDPLATTKYAEDYVQKQLTAPETPLPVKEITVDQVYIPVVQAETKPVTTKKPTVSSEDPKKAAWLAGMVSALVAKGIARDDIKPNVNVFTFNGWLKRRRCVKLGEHGVKYGGYTLFHVTQTKELRAKGSDQPVQPAVKPTVGLSKEQKDKLISTFKTLLG